MLNREEVKRIKKKYSRDTPVRLYSMKGEKQMPFGMEGKVLSVDDIGQIHVAWENGSMLALNPEEDQFDIISPEEITSEQKRREFIEKVNGILEDVDFKLLNMSCNSENTGYAAEKLLAMHQAFGEVYGEGYVDESCGMVMMPAVIRGRKSGIQTLALVTIDLESAGEHWNTVFLTPGGPIAQGNKELTQEQKKALSEYYLPYDYWYTPLVERDHHVDFAEMPESARRMIKMMDEMLAAGEMQEMDGPK